MSTSQGSSPRMRGAPRPERHEALEWRIIPADAGSTCGPGRVFGQNADHPRGCGEHLPSARLTYAVSGSSPRMRGALCAKISAVKCIGIIPADAGSTRSQLSKRQRSQDHPRGCGEHYAWPYGVDLSEGSSPRMRGAPLPLSGHVAQRRIIPADAGSTEYGEMNA